MEMARENQEEQKRLIDERFRGSEETPQEELPEFRTRTERLIFSNLSIEVDDPLFRSTVDGVIEILRDLPNVESAVSFYDTKHSRHGLSR